MLYICSHTFGGFSITWNSKIFPVVHEVPNELALSHLSSHLILSLSISLFLAFLVQHFYFIFLYSLIPANKANCHQMALLILYSLFFLQCSLLTVSFILGLWLTCHFLRTTFSPPTHISYLVLSVSFPLTLHWVFFLALYHSANCHNKITIIIFTINKSQYCITHFHKTLLFTEQNLCLFYNRCPTITC